MGFQKGIFVPGGGGVRGGGQNPLGKNRKQPTANGERKPMYILSWVIQIKSSHGPYSGLANHLPLYALVQCTVRTSDFDAQMSGIKI